jgi:hypothetical protein
MNRHAGPVTITKYGPDPHQVDKATALLLQQTWVPGMAGSS